MLSRVWARKGSRPRIVRDHRYGYAYLFSAACPEHSIAVGHICDRANTGEMNRHLADISAAVPTGRRAVLVLDGAGWHRSNDLEIPANISLLRLPPHSPELNPMENVFAFLKGNFLANRVFATVDDVRSAIANAWHSFLAFPVGMLCENKILDLPRSWHLLHRKFPPVRNRKRLAQLPRRSRPYPVNYQPRMGHLHRIINP